MGKKGFTLIELIMIIVIIGILAVVAVPRYFALQDQAQQAAEDGVVGAVRSGIYIWHANSVATGGGDVYPAFLDTEAADGISFDIVIENGVDAGGAGQWSDGDAIVHTYTGPTEAVYTYAPDSGSFTITP